MRFGLIANLDRQGAKEAIESFIIWAKKRSQNVILSDSLKKVVKEKLEFVSPDKIADNCDVVVSMGGDGTLLSTARIVGDRDAMLLGVNLGTLGFLTQITPKEMISCLDRIVKNDHEIQKRLVLEASVVGRGDKYFALNEVVVDNRPKGRLMDILLNINSENILTYRCDGLIIATPTGSTGYSLSVGGPIIHPNMEAIIAAPVSAFSLSARPMILRPTDELELTVGSGHEAAALTLDGQVTKELKSGETVLVKRARFCYNFIVFPENSFYKICKEKLHWGVTPKGESE